MKKIVIQPGGYHPFHAGHYSLFKAAEKKFPDADVYLAATNDTKTRPFPFEIKKKLAQLAGVNPDQFVQVKSPFKAEEITQKYDPESDVLIFVRSEKDRNEQPKPGGTKKDGSPSYFQSYDPDNLQPFSKHAYIEYLPTIEFGPGIKSATEIRNAWPNLNDKQKLAMVMSLYPATQKNRKLADVAVKMLDAGIVGDQVNEEGVAEGKRPNQLVVGAIQEVLPIAQEIWFHGSRATGKHRRNSDTDILVVVPDDIVGDQYLATVRTLQKLSSKFDNYDIQPTKSGTNIHRIAQEEGQLLWANKQGVKVNEDSFKDSGYKEIEFVCVNPEYPDATDPELQKNILNALKKIPGVIPLMQVWDDYSEGQCSLTAIYKGADKRKQIMKLANQLGVEIDLEQPVSDDYVDRAIRGEHEGQQEVQEATLVNDPEQGHLIVPDGGMGTWDEQSLLSNLVRKFASMAEMIKEKRYSNLYHSLYEAGVVENMLKALVEYENFKGKQGKRPIAKGKTIDMSQVKESTDYISEK